MPDFIVGEHYTREQVGVIAGLSARDRSGGAWMTGYTDWNGATYVFTNVGVPGRTGHDYPNKWDGKNLIWYGKTRARRGQRQIDLMISNTRPVMSSGELKTVNRSRMPATRRRLRQMTKPLFGSSGLLTGSPRGMELMYEPRMIKNGVVARRQHIEPFGSKGPMVPPMFICFVWQATQTR